MEFSERDTQYASQIVEQLLSRDGKRLEIEIERNLVVSDLESSADSFSTDLALAQDFDVGIPATRIAGDDGYIVPVSMFSLIGLPYPPYTSPLYSNQIRLRDRRWWRRGPWFYEWIHDALRLFRETEPSAGFRIISPDEAQEAFSRRAINFLATRIAAVRSFSEGENIDREKWGKPASLNLAQIFGGRKVVTPGCYFSVSTNSSGLRVFWSGAYYIAPNYFSHPTSPATSVLQAGTYIFGVDGGAYGNTIQWDTNAVTSLPGNPFVHLNY